jgi:LacI family transcriptional regulator
MTMATTNDDSATISTIRDVATHAGVSAATISNFLNETKRISPATRARIESAISDLNFVPNSASRVLRGSRNAVLGLVVPDLPDPFFAEVARGVEDAARSSNYLLVACNTYGNLDIERQYVTALAEMRVAGVIALPAYSKAASSHLAQLRNTGAKLVLLGEVEDREFCSTAFDDHKGGGLAIDHLLALGHRDILLVGGPGGEREVNARFDGAKDAFARAGHDPKLLRRMDATGASRAARSEVGSRIASLSRCPTAIFCASDSIALAAQGAIMRQGLRVPEDVAIVGYNDIEQTQDGAVPITTVHVPQYEMGQTAAHLLMSEFLPGHVHEHVVFEPTLVARASTLGTTRAG